MKGVVTAVCISNTKGVPKQDVGQVKLIEDHGLDGDAHAGPWHRQVSLLAEESIARMRAKGLDVGPGAFAENITTRGLDLPSLPVGTRLEVGPESLLEVTQIGKECHAKCAIFQQVGECAMPHEGVFAKVIRGGVVSAGDSVRAIHPVRAAVLTVSDKGSRGEREDASGAQIEKIISSIGVVVERKVVPDQFDTIAEELRRMADKPGVNLILTTGGTGLSPRDVTPEATLAVLDRLAPGIGEAMRAASMAKTPHAMLSRAVAGARGRVLIVNLPGSPRAVRECLEVLMPALSHAVATVSGAGGECAR